MTIRGKHDCALGLGSESMLSETSNTWWGRICHGMRKLIIVSEHHPVVFRHFRSYPALLNERKRHQSENGNVIHPFSMFSLIWKSLMIVVTMAHITCSSLQLCVFVDIYGMHIIDVTDVAIFVLDLICLTDMMIWFNMGFVDKKSGEIVLNRRRIVLSYCWSYWLPDLMSSLPLSMMMLITDMRWRLGRLVSDALPMVRVIRLVTVISDLRALLKMLTNSHIWFRVIRQMLLFTLAVHCFTCLLYVPSAVMYYVNGNLESDYTGFLDLHDRKRSIMELSRYDRYVKGLFVVMSVFCSTGFSMYPTYYAGELLINSVLLFFGSMFKMYTVVFALKTYMTVYNSAMRYQELMDQVEKYMQQKQFPASLMRRIREYYSYRFQESYYREKVALGCLSRQLRNEILLHTYQNLAEKVTVLRDLEPAFIGKLFGYLELQVYMPNDLIFHVGEYVHYIYFIYTGSVVMYSLRGVEAYHFEDGDFFGTTEFVTPVDQRLTTIVAIETSQVYRLSADNFRVNVPVDAAKAESRQQYYQNKENTVPLNHVLSNATLLERLKSEEQKRIKTIMLIDDLVVSEDRRSKSVSGRDLFSQTETSTSTVNVTKRESPE